jgi:predicted amidophosphoribosyltransferase
VAGARVLVLDDVLTDGSTLREVARVLRRAGAREVAGLILARPAWRERPPDSHSEP